MVEIEQIPEAEQEAPQDHISWTASEFIAHEKTSQWYITLAGVTAALALVVFLLTGDVVAILMIIFGASLFGVYAGRQPRQLPYQLNHHGLRIGTRLYDLQQFQSFSVVPEGAFSSIILMPLRRFAPMTTIYYAPEDEDKIVDVLSAQLPYAEHKLDSVERLMRRIRF